MDALPNPWPFPITKEQAVAMAGQPRMWGFRSYLDMEPPISFYTHPPPGSMAFFSSSYHGKPRKFNLAMAPERTIQPWTAAQIQASADQIRDQCWEMCKYIRKPITIWDLPMWFDTYDIWYMGVQNAFNVLSCIHCETEAQLPGIINSARGILRQWVSELLSPAECRLKLLSWEPSRIDVLQVFDHEDLDALKDLDNWYIWLVREVLHEARDVLVRGEWSPESARQEAMTAGMCSPCLVFFSVISHICRLSV